MNDQNLGRGQDSALEHSLASLYQQETPKGFEAAWRAAVRREEKIQMHTKEKPRFWRIALSSALGLVLVVGTLITGGLDLESKDSAGTRGLSNRAFQMDGGGGSVAPMATSRPEAGLMLDESYEMEAQADYENSLSAMPLPDVAHQVDSAAVQEKKIVRTADMTLATTAFEQDEEALRARVGGMGGYVENFYQYGDGSPDNLRRLTMTLRIPTEKLDEFLSGAAEIGRVTAKSENATDMTVQYADTALMQSTQRSKMERLQALLAKAETVYDLLQIENEIANTQYQLDSYETTLRSIDRQVERSAVTVTLVEETPAESAAATSVSLSDRVVNGLKASIKGIGQFFQNMLVFVVMAAPVAAGLALVSGVIWLVARHRKVRRNKEEI